MLGAFALPLYFVLLLAATIVTATHHSQPHDLALTLAGPDSSTSQIAVGLRQKSPGDFDISRVTDAGAARTAVLQRKAVGAVVIGGTAKAPTVTTYIAAGGGRSAASTVQSVGAGIATRFQTTAKVVDLAPVVKDDSLSTVVFYLVLYSGIGGYLTIIVLNQVVPRARLRLKYAISLGAAVIAPLIVLGLTSIFVDLNLSFAQFAAVYGIDALYVLTVALVVIMSGQLLGEALMFLVAPIAVFANLASSGGPAPESMLPGFWQALHSFWFGAGANEAMRDIVYFPGANPVRWIIQLLVWTIALLVITSAIEGVKLVWRLQSIVIRQAHHADSLPEHIQLLSVPKQTAEHLQAITQSGAARDPEGVDDRALRQGASLGPVAPDQDPGDTPRDDERTDTSAPSPVVG